MAVKIRLARRGRKRMAIYDVVVADVRAPRDGRFIEKLGTYNPNTDPASININNERALKWLMNGAQPSDTVKAMLSYRGILLQKHLQVGVLKGAISQEQADEKFEAWKSSKEASIGGKVDKLTKEKEDAKTKAMEAETAKNQARLDAIKKREDDAKAAADAEAAANQPQAESEATEAVATETEATEAEETKTEAKATEAEETKTEAKATEAEETKTEETETPEASTEESKAPEASAEDEDTKA